MREVKPHSFIYEIPNALPGDVCREIVRRFEEKTDQQNAGRIGNARIEESSIKKTTDIFIIRFTASQREAHGRQARFVPAVLDAHSPRGDG